MQRYNQRKIAVLHRKKEKRNSHEMMVVRNVVKMKYFSQALMKSLTFLNILVIIIFSFVFFSFNKHVLVVYYMPGNYSSPIFPCLNTFDHSWFHAGKRHSPDSSILEWLQKMIQVNKVSPAINLYPAMLCKYSIYLEH